jgi:O-antigen ligase
MKDHEEIETSKSSEWFDATLVNEKPTRLSGVVYVLLSVMMIFATIAYGSVETWALGLLSIIACLIMVFWLADSFVSQLFRFSTNLLQIPLLGLFLIGVIQIIPLGNLPLPTDLLSIPVSNTISVDPNITRLAVIQLLVYLVFLTAAFAHVNTQKRLRKMVFTIILFGAFWSFFGIIQWLSLIGSQDQFIYGFRPVNNAFPFASFVNKHHFAAFMEMTIGLTLSLLYGESTQKDKRMLLIIAIGLMGTGLVLTGSRGGLLSLLGVIGFVTLFNLIGKKVKSSSKKSVPSKIQNKLLLIGASLALILVLFGSVIFLGGEGALMRGTGMSTQSDISTGRFHFWQTALQIIKDHPVIGTGLDSFGVAFTKYDSWNGNMRIEQSHNEYLQILSDAGILGFGCVIAFIILLFKQGLGTANQSSDRFRRGVAVGALGGCFGIIVHSFFDFPLRTPSNSFFFLMLAVLATTTIIYPKLYRRHSTAAE